MSRSTVRAADAAAAGHLRYLSLGAGVQSSTLALMCAHGEVEPPQVAIFSDTGWEPKAVYQWLDWLEPQLPFPVYRVSAGNLRDEIVDMAEGQANHLRIPAFTRDSDGKAGILRRQCTREYKIAPVQQKVRALLGVASGQRMPRGKTATALIGISADEPERAKPAREKWVQKIYPLLDLRMQRGHCLEWMRRHGYPEPPRSSCIGCPFHSDREWRHLQRTDPGAFADAVKVDRLIRDSTGIGVDQPAYLHRSLRPLDQVDFSDLSDAGQLDLWGHWGNECEGMCGV